MDSDGVQSVHAPSVGCAGESNRIDVLITIRVCVRVVLCGTSLTVATLWSTTGSALKSRVIFARPLPIFSAERVRQALHHFWPKLKVKVCDSIGREIDPRVGYLLFLNWQVLPLERGGREMGIARTRGH